MEKGATEEELVKAILNEYDATEEQAKTAVKNTVELLNSNGFIED